MSEKTIGEGFKYPFNNWKRLFNFWWVLTIVGIFSVVGYFMEIIESLLKKKDKELPEFKGFWRLFKKGFMFFIVMLVPIIIIGFISGIISNIFKGILAPIAMLVGIFLDVFLAFMFINYVKKQKYEAVFDVKKVWAVMSKDWGNTLVAVGKQIVVIILLVLLSLPVITMIVTLPAMTFVGYYYLVDLYNKTA